MVTEQSSTRKINDACWQATMGRNRGHNVYCSLVSEPGTTVRVRRVRRQSGRLQTLAYDAELDQDVWHDVNQLWEA
jgi:hypothetical protein